MAKRRRKFSPYFKAQVGLEVLSDRYVPVELAPAAIAKPIDWQSQLGNQYLAH